MAKTKKTAQELREQAQKLLELAEQIENERAIRIGRLVMEYESRNWEGFDLEDFRIKINKIWHDTHCKGLKEVKKWKQE
jgi:hypothetical protein